MIIQVERDTDSQITAISFAEIKFNGAVGSTFAELFPGDATVYIIRTEAEELERNEAIKSKAQVYALTMQDVPAADKAWNDFTELLK